MDNITKLNFCIDMLNKIKRLSADVDINKYSKAIDDILTQVDDLVIDIASDYISLTAPSIPAIDTEQL